MKIHLGGETYNCTIKLNTYKNGRLRIDILEEDGMQIGVATVNMPDQKCDIGHCWIKDYAENAGMYHELVRLEVIAPATLCMDAYPDAYIYYSKFLNSHNSIS